MRSFLSDVVAQKNLSWKRFLEPTSEHRLDAVNAYNATFVFGKAAISKQDALVSSRVVNGVAGWTNEQVVAEFAGFLGATDALLDHLKSYVVAAGPSVAGGGYQHLSAQAPGVLTGRSGLASRPARLARLPINRR